MYKTILSGLDYCLLMYLAIFDPSISIVMKEFSTK